MELNGEKTNILASGGIKGEIRMFHPASKVSSGSQIHSSSGPGGNMDFQKILLHILKINLQLNAFVGQAKYLRKEYRVF